MFQLTPLPYAYNALEPFIDETTMRLHHDQLLKGFVDGLNAILERCPALQNRSLKQLLCRPDRVPQPLRLEVQRNAGGVYNHDFFFAGMIPGGRAPTGQLADHIACRYGGAAQFQAKFKEKALAVFGSGYTWLVCNKRGQLEIMNTCGQDTPLPMGCTPLACIDVWEHAYFLKRHADRGAYVDAWFRVADFGKASGLYGG